jgi:hypothetical protein
VTFQVASSFYIACAKEKQKHRREFSDNIAVWWSTYLFNILDLPNSDFWFTLSEVRQGFPLSLGPRERGKPRV